jgi:hypothetical protein
MTFNSCVLSVWRDVSMRMAMRLIAGVILEGSEPVHIFHLWDDADIMS